MLGRFYILRGTFPDLAEGVAVIQFPNPNPAPLSGDFSAPALAVEQSPGPKVLIAATFDPSGIMRSDNGDTAVPTWAAMTIALPPRPPPNPRNLPDFVVSVAFVPAEPQQAYALTYGGRVFFCPNVDDPASAWTLRPARFHQGGVTASGDGGPGATGLNGTIAASIENAQLLYAVAAGQVFRSQDAAQSWEPVASAGAAQLPAGISLNSIVVGPGTLYVAGSPGVLVSADAGQSWFPFDEGLPNVEVRELLFSGSHLYAVTFGRGLWRQRWGPAEPEVTPGHISDPGWLISLLLGINGGEPAAGLWHVIGSAAPPHRRVSELDVSWLERSRSAVLWCG